MNRKILSNAALVADLGPRPFWPFYDKPDETNANGAGIAAPTSQNAETSASDGKNTGDAPDGQSAATADSNAPSGAPSTASQDEPPKPKADGFKPITSQKELDNLVKDRLKREREKSESEAKQKQLESEGKWKELYDEAKKGYESRVSELETELDSLRERISSGENATRIEKAVSDAQLSAEAAELFRDAVAGKGLDAKTLAERAKKYAKVAAAPVAPKTEGGVQDAKATGVQTNQSKDHHSFNEPGGVKW